MKAFDGRTAGGRQSRSGALSLAAPLAAALITWSPPSHAEAEDEAALAANAEDADNDGPAAESSNEAAESSNEAAESSNETAEPFVAVSLNLIGLALFGPNLDAEFGSTVTGFLRVRAFGLGYLSHDMFTPEDNRDLALSSFAAGLGGRVYLGDHSFVGPFLGAAVEYLTVDITETVRLGTLDTRTTFLIPSLEGGYRHVIGTLLLGGGLQVGYAFAQSERCTFSAGSCEVEPREDTFYGQLVGEVGAVF